MTASNFTPSVRSHTENCPFTTVQSGKFLPYLGGISACYVDFSRDGQWIAYVSYPEGTLWRSRIDGSDKTAADFAAPGGGASALVA